MIPLFKVNMSNLASSRAGEVLNSGYIGQGPKVDEFERAFEKLNGFPEGSFVATNSCTSAIDLVLRFLELRPDEHVISSPMTCVASNAPIVNRGASINWAGVTREGLIDPASVEKMWPDRAAAIMGVDWTGKVAEYGALKKFGVPVIQDAAHDPYLADYSHDELGDFVCFSFGPIKHLTTIDGGGVFVNHPKVRAQVATALRLLRWYGLDRTSSKDFRCEQDIVNAGMKWHMNDVSAAVGLANLPALKATVEIHRQNALVLRNCITNPHVWTHPYDRRSNYWVYPLQIMGGHRDKFAAYMRKKGIAASQVHARNDKHPAYLYPTMDKSSIDTFDRSQINIPCGWWVDRDSREKIITAVQAFKP